MEFIQRYYNKGDVLKLFLACSFPIHVWSIFMFLRDFDWITERTNAWDAVGVGSYALILALIESLFVFIIIFGLSFLVHKTWLPETRLAMMSILIFVVSLWAIFTQTFFLLGGIVPKPLFTFLVNSEHPFRFLFGIIGGLVIISVAAPIILMLRSEKLVKGTLGLIDRIILLSSLYLFLDVVGIVIVIIRNV